MTYGPEINQGIPTSTAFIRNVRSKVFELLDFISHCENSEKALNAWRELCAFGYATIMDLDDRGLLPTPETSKTDWKAHIARIEKLWDELKTSEKTEISLVREGGREKYRIQWDSYVGTFAPAEFQLGIQIMDKEKYDAIDHRMTQFWGYCEFILYACNVISIKDQIEIPMPLDSYSGEQMAAGIGSRKVPKRAVPSDQTPQR